VPHASQVPVDGIAVVVGLGVAALVAVGVVPWRWDRWHRRRVGRTVSTVMAVVLVVVACGATVNRLGSFYPTLGSLIGTSSNPADGTVVEAGTGGARLAGTRGVRVARARDGHGTTVHLTLSGPRSRLTRDVDVYLPADYDDPAAPGLRFPVVEWFPGFPGEPREVMALFGLPQLLDDAIAQHRLPPVVVLVPDTNGEPRLSHDEECVDAVGGPADDTFLSADVRSWALQQLHVRGDRRGWALAGWSSGGYCALDLAVRHPQWYGTAASQSGYDHAAEDVTTGDLFRGRADVAAANDLVSLLHTHPTPLAMLLTAGTGETEEQQAIERVLAAAPPEVSSSTIGFPGGGHNRDAVRAQLPTILDWLGEHLPGPVAAGEPVPARLDHEPAPWPLPDPGAPGALVGTEG
jgi:enterochelin esterase-like enzyme